jgi:hypothetical protein
MEINKILWRFTLTILILISNCQFVYAFNLLPFSFCWRLQLEPRQLKYIPIYLNPNYPLMDLTTQENAVISAVNVWNQALITGGANTRLNYMGPTSTVTYIVPAGENNQVCDIFFSNTSQTGGNLAETQPYCFIDHSEDNQESDTWSSVIL